MGKEERLGKILPKGKGLIIPIDHALSSFPEKGLGNLSKLIPLISVSYTHLTLPTKA